MKPFITQEMIDQLVELSGRYRAQARSAFDSNAYEAALVMIGSAIETMLFTTVAMSQHAKGRRSDVIVGCRPRCRARTDKRTA